MRRIHPSFISSNTRGVDFLLTVFFGAAKPRQKRKVSLFSGALGQML
jgi:hypothetical protein